MMSCKSYLACRLGVMGFTLIELLVVVLIIGILAAIALPQYQKATERAKATEALSITRNLVQAAERYHLATGTWPMQFDVLDVDVPWTGHEYLYTNTNFKDTRSNKDWSWQIAQWSQSTSFKITRLTGKYRGARFDWTVQSGDNPQNVGWLACDEYQPGTVFKGAVGDYCQKVLHGTRVGTTAVFKIAY